MWFCFDHLHGVSRINFINLLKEFFPIKKNTKFYFVFSYNTILSTLIGMLRNIMIAKNKFNNILKTVMDISILVILRLDLSDIKYFCTSQINRILIPECVICLMKQILTISYLTF